MMPFCYLPVLTLISRLKGHISLPKGDFKNSLCNAIFPEYEITVIRWPIDITNASKCHYWLLHKTLYVLCHSPQHWYKLITYILTKKVP